MIALFIWLERHLVPGALGVRLVTVLCGALCIPLLWCLVEECAPDRRKIGRFVVIVSSAVLFNAFGFITTPDSPLLFFSLVFYLAYRRFLRERGMWPIVGLGLSMALLLYSKYHAVLIIGFVLLSNWRILLTRRFLAAAVLTLLLCLQHLAAGIQIGFPSISYQLTGRVTPRPYRWVYTASHLLNQLLILGPFMAFPLLRAVFRYPRRDEMDAAMQFTFFRVFAFFLSASFQHRVEAHWMAPMTQPNTSAKWLYRLYVPTMGCLLIERLTIAANFLPLRLAFYGRKTWIPAVSRLSKVLPMVFENTYALAAKYGFYTGKRTYSFENAHYRWTQYDLGDGESQFWNQRVFLRAAGFPRGGSTRGVYAF